LFLHYDSAPAHKALSVKEFLSQKCIIEMEHPPSSPNLALIDFELFPELKSSLKGRRLQDIEDIQKKKKKVMMALEALPQQEFQKCFQQWLHSWAKYIAAQGEYFEGDPVSVSCKYNRYACNKSFQELHSHTLHNCC
jgi:histone-lysine N-methyltransferase SETMAR